MLDVVVNMFTRRHPQRDATLALTRIMTRYDMSRIAYVEGIVDDRRSGDERNVAFGVWLFPCGPSAKAVDIDLSTGIPAVSHDVRAEGLGILTPVQLKHKNFMVAVQGDKDVWKFFRCRVCHNTSRAGGWFQLGLNTDRVIELESYQRAAFREHIEHVQSAASAVVE